MISESIHDALTSEMGRKRPLYEIYSSKSYDLVIEISPSLRQKYEYARWYRWPVPIQCSVALSERVACVRGGHSSRRGEVSSHNMDTRNGRARAARMANHESANCGGWLGRLRREVPRSTF